MDPTFPAGDSHPRAGALRLRTPTSESLEAVDANAPRPNPPTDQNGDHVCESAGPSSFPLFLRLPPELREMVLIEAISDTEGKPKAHWFRIVRPKQAAESSQETGNATMVKRSARPNTTRQVQGMKTQQTPGSFNEQFQMILSPGNKPSAYSDEFIKWLACKEFRGRLLRRWTKQVAAIPKDANIVQYEQPPQSAENPPFPLNLREDLFSVDIPKFGAHEVDSIALLAKGSIFGGEVNNIALPLKDTWMPQILTAVRIQNGPLRLLDLGAEIERLVDLLIRLTQETSAKLWLIDNTLELDHIFIDGGGNNSRTIFHGKDVRYVEISVIDYWVSTYTTRPRNFGWRRAVDSYAVFYLAFYLRHRTSTAGTPNVGILVEHSEESIRPSRMHP